MSEIRGRVRTRIIEILVKPLKVPYQEDVAEMMVQGAINQAEEILNIEELAVVDREAELPIILTEPQQSIAWNIHYLKDLIRKEGWVKEDKK